MDGYGYGRLDYDDVVDLTTPSESERPWVLQRLKSTFIKMLLVLLVLGAVLFIVEQLPDDTPGQATLGVDSSVGSTRSAVAAPMTFEVGSSNGSSNPIAEFPVDTSQVETTALATPATTVRQTTTRQSTTRPLTTIAGPDTTYVATTTTPRTTTTPATTGRPATTAAPTTSSNQLGPVTPVTLFPPRTYGGVIFGGIKITGSQSAFHFDVDLACNGSTGITELWIIPTDGSWIKVWSGPCTSKIRSGHSGNLSPNTQYLIELRFEDAPTASGSYADYILYAARARTK